jgi:hypothetical protein
VAQLYSQAPGSLYIAFYGSQGCGGGVLTRLHMGFEVFTVETIQLDLLRYVVSIFRVEA